MFFFPGLRGILVRLCDSLSDDYFDYTVGHCWTVPAEELNIICHFSPNGGQYDRPHWDNETRRDRDPGTREVSKLELRTIPAPWSKGVVRVLN